MQVYLTVWPRGLRDKDILDLSVRAREHGEKLACWLAEVEDLFILFDGKRGNSLGDYRVGPDVAPGAYLLIDGQVDVRQSMSGPPVSGIVLNDPHRTLSYEYQSEWGKEYFEKARKFNKSKSLTSLGLLWELHANMNFAWYYGDSKDIEELKKISTHYQAFNEVILKELNSMPHIHIPLISDPEKLGCSMQ